MYDNQNFPWYPQQVPEFKKLYDGLFPIVSQASPLDIWHIFDVNQLTGLGLLWFGRYWGLRGMWGAVTDGLVYDIDKWSTDRKWSGEFKDLNAQIYRNFIKMKTYINGRNYTLGLIKEALDILLAGHKFEVTVTEEYLHFIINLTASSEVLNIMFNLEKYDSQFLGKPSGISYEFKYTPKDTAAQ